MTIWAELRFFQLAGIQIVHRQVSIGEKFLGETYLNQQPVTCSEAWLLIWQNLMNNHSEAFTGWVRSWATDGSSSFGFCQSKDNQEVALEVNSLIPQLHPCEAWLSYTKTLLFPATTVKSALWNQVVITTLDLIHVTKVSLMRGGKDAILRCASSNKISCSS